MAPSAVDISTPEPVAKSQSREPLNLSGALDQYESFDVTPVIGREFPTAKLVDWLDSPDSDSLLRDLAITSKEPAVWSIERGSNALTNSVQFSLSAGCGLLPRPGRPHQ